MNEPSIHLPEDKAKQLNKAADDARAQASRLKVEFDAATKADQIWSNVLRWTEAKWWFHVRALFDREVDFFDKLREAGHESTPALEIFLRLATEQTENLILSLPRDIELMAEQHHLPLARNLSRHPRYQFREGFITVDIDEAKRVARIRDYEEKLAEIPPDIGALAEILTREDKRLFGRSFNGGQFLEKLRRQYLAILKKAKMTDGDPVPLRHIARRLSENERNFRRDEFVVDLSRLAVEGPAQTGEFRFELQQTKDTEQGMLLFGPAGRGMVGLLIFRKVPQ